MSDMGTGPKCRFYLLMFAYYIQSYQPNTPQTKKCIFYSLVTRILESDFYLRSLNV